MNPAIKSILKKAGIICLSTILFAMCSVLIYITKITGNMHRLDGSPEIPVMETNPNIPAEPMNMGSGYWTIAVFGVDSRNGMWGKAIMRMYSFCAPSTLPQGYTPCVRIQGYLPYEQPVHGRLR